MQQETSYAACWQTGGETLHGSQSVPRKPHGFADVLRMDLYDYGVGFLTSI